MPTYGSEGAGWDWRFLTGCFRRDPYTGNPTSQSPSSCLFTSQYKLFSVAKYKLSQFASRENGATIIAVLKPV